MSSVFAHFRHFLQLALQRAKDCRKAYYLYTQQGAECEVSYTGKQLSQLY